MGLATKGGTTVMKKHWHEETRHGSLDFVVDL